MKQISEKTLVALIVVFVVLSAIGIVIALQSLAIIPEVIPSSASGTVSAYVFGKPTTDSGVVTVEVLPNGTKPGPG